jgi:hypothetical protein
MPLRQLPRAALLIKQGHRWLPPWLTTHRLPRLTLAQVAGVAAQIRQYFETFNPSVITTGCALFTGSGGLSQATCDNLSNPKGATIKAMLIHSGEQMAEYDSQNVGTTQASTPLLGTPDMYQVPPIVAHFTCLTLPL